MNKIDELRKQIDNLDVEIKKLFVERMEVVSNIKDIKAKENIKVLDENREEEIIKNALEGVDERYKEEVKKLFISILNISKEFQQK